VEKRLCKDVRVKGYPTLLFFQGGQRIEYEGLRGLGDLIGFANKAVIAGEGVKDVDAAEFEKLEEHEEVIFLYLYDHATTSEDFAALERVTLSLIGHARIVKTQDPVLYQRFKISTWPRLLVSRDGKPTYFTALAPKDMRDTRKVLGWMQTVWQPIVPELTAANAKDIMGGKLVVLAILSRERSDEFVIAKRELKNAALEWIDKQTQAFQLERQELRDAKQLRIEEAEDRNDQRGLRSAKSIRINMDDIERKEVQFAWVDGVFWERWVKTTFGVSVKDGERVVVNDEEVSQTPSHSKHHNTNSAPEPSLLGHNHYRQPDRTKPHLDPRDSTQDRRLATKNLAEIDLYASRSPLLFSQTGLPQAPDRELPFHRRCIDHVYDLCQRPAQERSWKAVGHRRVLAVAPCEWQGRWHERYFGQWSAAGQGGLV